MLKPVTFPEFSLFMLVLGRDGAGINSKHTRRSKPDFDKLIDKSVDKTLLMYTAELALKR